MSHHLRFKNISSTIYSFHILFIKLLFSSTYFSKKTTAYSGFFFSPVFCCCPAPYDADSSPSLTESLILYKTPPPPRVQVLSLLNLGVLRNMHDWEHKEVLVYRIFDVFVFFKDLSFFTVQNMDVW